MSRAIVPEAAQEAAPIFIMSSERSGSNLLRSLLSNHSRLDAPTAPQLLPTFTELVGYYGSLDEKPPALQLMEDMLAVVNHPYYGWGLAASPDALWEYYSPSSFLDIFHLIYTEHQRRYAKFRYVCKENRIFEYGAALHRHFPSGKFVYLYRDPRDIAASYQYTPAGPKSPYGAATKWEREQTRCRTIIQNLKLPTHHLSYEELVTDTENTISSLLVFLEEPVEDRCFQTMPEKNDSLTWNVYWENLAKPVQSTNTGKYKKIFRRQTINMIETLTTDSMKALGYPFETPANWQAPRFFRTRNYLISRLKRYQARRRAPETAAALKSRNQLIASIETLRMESGRQTHEG